MLSPQSDKLRATGTALALQGAIVSKKGNADVLERDAGG